MKVKFFLLIAALFFAVSSCEKEVFEPVTEEVQIEEVQFRSVADYAGIWKIQNPFAKYYQFNADGTYFEVMKFGLNFKPKDASDCV